MGLLINPPYTEVLNLALVTMTASYTASMNDMIILGDATAATLTITLPTAAGIRGKTYIIKKIDSSLNAVIIETGGLETIDGEMTKVIGSQWSLRQVTSDGTNWVVTGSFGSL